MAISNSVELLLGGVFDYAGMYPPANLSFEDAFSEAVQLPQRLRFPGLIGNGFVGDLHSLEKISGSLVPMRFCLLASEQDLVKLPGVIASLNGVAVTTYEFKTAEPQPNRTVAELIPRLECQFAEPLGSVRLEEFIRRCAETKVGVKLRCGGQGGYPLSAIVDGLIDAIDRRVPLKFTAGLHHPLVEERYDNQIGFLGLVLACGFRHKFQQSFTMEYISQLLQLKDVSQLNTDNGIEWRDFSLAVQDIAEFRLYQRIQIGSCSLTEPDEDLARVFGDD